VETGHTNTILDVHELFPTRLPESLLEGIIPPYEAFLEERRKLMALKIKNWFECL